MKEQNRIDVHNFRARIKGESEKSYLALKEQNRIDKQNLRKRRKGEMKNPTWQ